MNYLLIPVLFLLSTCSSQVPDSELINAQASVIEISDLYQAGQLQFERGIHTLPALEQAWQESRSQRFC